MLRAPRILNDAAAIPVAILCHDQNLFGGLARGSVVVGFPDEKAAIAAEFYGATPIYRSFSRLGAHRGFSLGSDTGCRNRRLSFERMRDKSVKRIVVSFDCDPMV